MIHNDMDPEEKKLLKVGGISAFALVLGYLLTFPVYARVGAAPPGGIEAQLVYYAEHAAGWRIILGLMVFTDLLLVPVFLSLYQALKEINRSAMRLAVASIGLFVALDLALTWTAYSALIATGIQYAAATTDAQRAVFAAAAVYPSALLASPLLGVYAILIPSLAALFTGPVMLRGVFNKTTAYLALAMGVTGIMFMGSYLIGFLGVFRIINALLATAWYLFVGFGLCKLSRR